MLDKYYWKSLPTGTLSDAIVTNLANNEKLITKGFNKASVKQACYELHASTTFYEVGETRENKKIEVDEAGYILRPHSYVTAIVSEHLELPPNIIGRILAKGQLFSVGILPVCTYADPGFSGRLGITLSNASHRHIVIKPGQAIAKIEFSVLPQEVETPYRGQHGYETEFWPIPVQLYADNALLTERNLNPESHSEILKSYGPVVANLQKKVNYYERTVWIQIFITILLFSGIIAIAGDIGWLQSIGLGIATNLLTTIGVNTLSSRARHTIGNNE